ncbi:MAG TPA: hypothetical protein VFE24_01115 [Pirellulales bacterium]|jgi:hypothetical protein|nr:hypothetical protein [Pirellulales bacterium]
MNRDDRNRGLASPGKLLLRNSLYLTGVIVLAAPLLGLWLGSAHGAIGWQAAGVAALVCWSGSILALLVASFAKGPNRALLAILAGMVFRMGLPLVVGTVLTQRGSPLAAGGVFPMMLALYFVTLLVETPLVLGLARQNPLPKEVS